MGFLVCRLIEYSHVNILPQITQITQRGMQQAALSRRERQIGEVKAVLWFVCVNQRDLRETSGVSSGYID